MEEENKLIEVKQLPIIEEKLQKVSGEIEIKVKQALELVCNEENVKTIKILRADLNKDYKNFEEQRKIVKEKILKPYNEFEDIYKRYISDKYRNADVILKGRIEVVENDLKAQKEQEIINYFEEYKKSLEIDFVSFENAKINVTLSASLKKLKEECKEYLDKIVDDIQLINSQEHKTEIMVEYKQTLNVSKSIQTVLNRIELIKKEEEIKAKQELERKEIKEILEAQSENIVEAPMEEKINNIPDNIIEVEELEILTMEFKVQGTLEQLKELKESINEIGLEIIRG